MNASVFFKVLKT